MAEARLRAPIARILAQSLSRNSRHALIFDNNRPSVRNIRRTLESIGFECTVCDNFAGLSGKLSLIENGKLSVPVVLLIDLHVDKEQNYSVLGKADVVVEDVNKTGLQLARVIIETRHLLSNVPIIFISDHENMVAREIDELNRKGYKCHFVAKRDFDEHGTQLVQKCRDFFFELVRKSGGDIDTAQELDLQVNEYERLFAELAGRLGVSEEEWGEMLGFQAGTDVGEVFALSGSPLSRDVTDRIDLLLEIAGLLALLVPETKVKDWVRTHRLPDDGPGVYQVLVYGAIEELLTLRAFLEQLTGGKL